MSMLTAIIASSRKKEVIVVPPQLHRYWRLVFTYGEASNVTITEMRMMNAEGGANLCSGGTAISSASPISPAVNAFDGNVAAGNIYRSASITLQDEGNWLGYVFATAVEINSVEIVYNSTNIEQPWQGWVQYSDNGTTWTNSFRWNHKWLTRNETAESHRYVAPIMPSVTHVPGVLLTIDPKRTKTDLAGFPLYVDLRKMPAAFWSATNGTDLRAKSIDGATSYPIDLVWIDTVNKCGAAYVKIPLITTSDFTHLVLTWDGSSVALAVTDPIGRNAVWSDYQWVIVPATDATDRTGKAVSAPVTTGTPTFEKPLTRDASGGGRLFTGLGNYIDQAVADVSTMSGIFTMSASLLFDYYDVAVEQHAISYRRAASGTTNRRVGISGTLSTAMAVRSWEDQSGFDQNTQAEDHKNWHRGTVVFDGANPRRFYLDGAFVGSNTQLDTSARQFDTIGLGREDPSNSSPFFGRLGFSYLRPGITTEAWVEAEWKMLNDITFVRFDSDFEQPVHRWWRLQFTGTLGASSFVGLSNIQMLGIKGGGDLTNSYYSPQYTQGKTNSPSEPIHGPFRTTRLAATYLTSAGSNVTWDFTEEGRTHVESVTINPREIGYTNQYPSGFKLQYSDDYSTWTDKWTSSILDETDLWSYDMAKHFYAGRAKPADPGKTNPHRWWRIRMFAYFDGTYYSVVNLQLSADMLDTANNVTGGFGRNTSFSEGVQGSAFRASRNTGSHDAAHQALEYRYAAPVTVNAVSFASRDSFAGQAVKSFAIDYSDDGEFWFESFRVANLPAWLPSEVRSFVDPDAVGKPRVRKISKYVVSKSTHPRTTKISKYIIAKATP